MHRKIGFIALAALFSWTAAAQDNMIENADFEGDAVEPWGTYGDATAVIDNDDVFAGSGSLRTDVPAAGANFWDSGLQYNAGALTFDANTLHTWAFFAKSDPPVEINIKPELGADPWTAYGETRANLTGDWTEYWTEYTPDTDVNPGSLTLHIAFAEASIWLDNARWYHGAYTPGELPTAVEAEGKTATTWATLKSK